MIDAVPEKKVVKMNATIDDDINLILDAITKVDAAFVLLVLPEGNDLANSPIGLKALRKKTYEKGKRMVLVMPKGSGYDLAKKAGFIASTSQDAVTGDVWQTVMQQYDEYKHTMAGMNSKKELPHHIEKKVEYMSSVPDHLPVPEIVKSSEKPEKEGKVEDENKVDDGEGVDQVESENKADVSKSSNKVDAPPVSEKKDGESAKIERIVSDDQSKHEKLAGQNITGIDFSKMMKGARVPSFFSKPKTPPMSANTIVAPQEINTFHPDIVPKKVGATLAKVKNKREMSGWARFFLFTGIAVLIAAIGTFAAYYYYFPKVFIRIDIQSNSLKITDSVLATSAVSGFDVNLKEIQMTKEKVEKNGRISFKATESGTDGTKASGTITVINSDASSKTVPVGTLVTSGDKKFVVSGASVVVDVSAPMAITATEFGEAYNLPASSIFAISGFPTLSGQNSAALTGGTKRTFTVVGQKDVDKALKALQDQLAKEAESDLAYMNLDKGYEFIKSSVKTVVKGKPEISPAVGAEVKETDEEPNVSMVINTTALYYHSVSLSQLAEQMLLNKHKIDKGLSADEAARTSIEQMTVKVDKITVEKDDKVTIVFTASGLATSRVDIDTIRSSVAGKEWPKMLEYLSSLPTLAKAPDVTFSPAWLPTWARYVPSEVSRIDVRVHVVAPETATE